MAAEPDRDDVPGAGAAPRRIEDKPALSLPPDSDDADDRDHAGQLAGLRSFYAAGLEAVRRCAAPAERAARVADLKRQQRAAVRALTDRRRDQRAAARLRRLLQRASRPAITGRAGALSRGSRDFSRQAG